MGGLSENASIACIVLKRVALADPTIGGYVLVVAPLNIRLTY